MIKKNSGLKFSASGVRLRLAGAVALALAPVLLLGAAQSALSFKREGEERRAGLAAAALRAANVAQSRTAASEIMLDMASFGSIGDGCAGRLAQLTERLSGYSNIIRLDALGRTACSAYPFPEDAIRGTRPWFHALAAGQRSVVTVEPGADYARQAALIDAVRVTRIEDGGFAGALLAVIPLAGLDPSADPVLPPGSQLTLASASGEYLLNEPGDLFPPLPRDFPAKARGGRAFAWSGDDLQGRSRDFSAGPFLGDDLFVVLSAPAPPLLSWERLDPISALLLPLLAFGLALLATLFAAERAVVRWFSYLERLAGIYSRGRFSVRPLRAREAPQEIHSLAESLSEMAATIAARDAALRESLAHKDALMREIHHRVKNNLQVISSLLNLQQRALTDPEARAAVGDTRQRISALAQIYKALYQGDDLQRVDLRAFLEELTAQVLAADSGHPVRTEVVADAVALDPDKLAPISLFAVEALSFAQKQSLAADGGLLKVEFHVAGETARLLISEQGRALEGSPRPPDGITQTLMTAFARQLRGQVTFDATPGAGLAILLTFPAPEAKAAPGT